MCLYALRMSEVILGPQASLSTLLETESQQDCSILHTPGFRGLLVPPTGALELHVCVSPGFSWFWDRNIALHICVAVFYARVISTPQDLLFEQLFTNGRNLSGRQCLLCCVGAQHALSLGTWRKVFQTHSMLLLCLALMLISSSRLGLRLL